MLLKENELLEREEQILNLMKSNNELVAEKSELLDRIRELEEAVDYLQKEREVKITRDARAIKKWRGGYYGEK